MKSFFLSLVFLVNFMCPAFGFHYDFDLSNFYLSGFFGTNYLHIQKSPDRIVKSTPGILIGTSIGYDFEDFRVESELSYRFNAYEEDIPLREHLFFDYGRLEKIAFGINIYHDFRSVFFLPYLKPYFGIGINYKKDFEKIVLKIYNFSTPHEYLSFKGTVRGFETQLIFGFSIPLSENNMTKVEYRYLKDDNNYSDHSFVLNVSKLF